MTACQDVTALLDDWGRGDREALDRMLPLVYAELRRILVDHARRRNANKRGDDRPRVSIDAAREAPPRDEICVLALDRVLERLQDVDPGPAQVVELRAFGGLTIEEAALVMKVSPSTAQREWRTARAWLTRELEGPPRP